jgi:hypothetical protein
VAYDADPDATYNPATGVIVPTTWLELVNENFRALGAAWTAFTPTWTADTVNPSIGNGTISGGYLQVGKTLLVSYYVLAGSTTTFGTGAWSLTLPNSLTSAARRQQIGGYALDASSGFYYVLAGRVDASATTVVRMASNGASPFDATSPITWTTGDWFVVEGVIQIA